MVLVSYIKKNELVVGLFAFESGLFEWGREGGWYYDDIRFDRNSQNIMRI